MTHGESAGHDVARRARMRAGWIALCAGIVLLGAKFQAWNLTGSQVVFSDAMESIVNVAAAAFLLFAVHLASQPADESHPYGHGKIEFVTSGFEGGLIAFAAIVIITESIDALWRAEVPHELDAGMLIVGGAGAANLVLGIYLVRTGRRVHSAALVADGKHVISDFWTSAGAVVGLLLVQLTELHWLDPLLAIAVALLLLKTSLGLLRQAARGLMDEVDPAVIAEVAAALEAGRTPGIIEIHDLRAINLGNAHHVDLHVVVPEFWSVERSHEEMDALQVRVLDHQKRRSELQFHMDPCQRAYCVRCDYPECPVRAAVFDAHRPFTAETVLSGPEPPDAGDLHDDPLPRPIAD